MYLQQSGALVNIALMLRTVRLWLVINKKTKWHIRMRGTWLSVFKNWLEHLKVCMSYI